MEKEVSLQEKILERGGQNLLFVVICFLLVGLAAPLLLVFLIKSPQPEEHIFIFGISYYKLVFVFFVSAAVMVHTSLFFLRANLWTIFAIFVISLFCCFPLIVGLRNNLTLYQAIVEIPLFARWPFFLKPAYIMIEFLIPAGIIVYLFLQIRSIFSKKRHGYAFLCAAAYLSIAAFLGFSALIQAEEPNIVTALVREKGDHVQKDVAAVLPGTTLQDFSSGEDNMGSSRSSTLPVEEAPKHPGPESAVSKTRQSAARETPVSNETAMAELEQKMQLLTDRADRIIVELGQMRKLITEPRDKPQEKKVNAVAQKKEISESPAPTATEKLPANMKAIAELQHEVRQLSGKVDHILEALNHMANVLPERQENLQKDRATVEEKVLD
jgi:hypothetical protein